MFIFPGTSSQNGFLPERTPAACSNGELEKAQPLENAVGVWEGGRSPPGFYTDITFPDSRFLRMVGPSVSPDSQVLGMIGSSAFADSRILRMVGV